MTSNFKFKTDLRLNRSLMDNENNLMEYLFKNSEKVCNCKEFYLIYHSRFTILKKMNF